MFTLDSKKVVASFARCYSHAWKKAHTVARWACTLIPLLGSYLWVNLITFLRAFAKFLDIFVLDQANWHEVFDIFGKVKVD